MTKKKNENEEINWKTTSADVRCRKKGSKIYFFISLEDGKQVGFSYHENFMKKVLENDNAEKKAS